jgi:hypothetical protein
MVQGTGAGGTEEADSHLVYVCKATIVEQLLEGLERQHLLLVRLRSAGEQRSVLSSARPGLAGPYDS